MHTLLTVRQLQELLQVDRITIYRMLTAGRLHGFKVGGQWRFSRQAVEQWLLGQQASLEISEPPQPANDLCTSKTLPLSCIRAIQDIVAEALGVGLITTAADGTPITSIANSCEFCSLILSTNAGRQGCIASWRAAAGRTPPWPQSAACHAGLQYVCGRIEIQRTCVAATHAGQFLDHPPAHGDWPGRLAILAAATGLPAQALQNALARVPVLDGDRRQQISRLLQRVAVTFSEIGEERLSLLGRLRRIAEMTTYP